MAYEIYKNKHNMEDYFQTWDSDNYRRLTKALKTQIYDKYTMKCEVFDRDDFSCQNIECEYPDSPLTVHHVRFQKNGGKDSARNCITLCKTCHQGYHRGKRRVVFANKDSLPAHLSGHTFQLKVIDAIDWKKIKAEMKVLRKSLAKENLNLTWEQVALLMKFLELNFGHEGEDD